MFNKIGTLLAIVIASAQLIGQNYNAHILNEVTYPSLDDTYKEYEIIEFDSETMWADNMDASGLYEMKFSIGNKMSWVIYLHSSNILGDTYKASRETLFKNGQLATPLMGWVKGDPNSHVRLTLGANYISGYVFHNNKKMVIEPLPELQEINTKSKYVLYDESNTLSSTLTCGSNQKYDLGFKDELPFSQEGQQICQVATMAIASDFLMFQSFGSVTAVENRNLSIINSTQGNYTSVFNDDIQFVVVEQLVSDCANCDPWTSSTDKNVVLNDFTSWANGGGFGIAHDVGQLWTDRDFIGSSVGIAWLSAVCSSVRYNVCQNGSSGALNVVLSSHELGHNFGMDHDESGTSFIMSPSLTSTSTWSQQSVTEGSSFIESLIARGTCLTECGGGSGGMLPEIFFSASTQSACVNDFIQFADASLNDPVAWQWEFDGGVPSTSSQQNPVVIYRNVGKFNVTLRATNAEGASTFTKVDYITIQDEPTPSFTPSTAGFAVNFSNTSQNADSYIWDLGDGQGSIEEHPTHTYTASGSYTVSLEAINSCESVSTQKNVNIQAAPIADFSADQVDICEGSVVKYESLSTENGISWQWIFQGGTPSSSTDQSPAVRYDTEGLFDTRLTVTNSNGSDELIRNNLIGVTPLPLANYSFETEENVVSFTNLSTNWNEILWDFGDGIRSIEINPTHVYEESGSYLVGIRAFNQCGVHEFESILEISIVVSATNQESQTKDLLVYPNPARDQIFLINNEGRSNHYYVMVYDINGRLVDIYSKSDNQTRERPIDISHLASGLYFIRFQSGNKRSTVSFIKE